MSRSALLLVTLVLAASAASACSRPPAPVPAPPPSAAPAPTPAPPGTAQVPGQLLDLTNWKLTLPTGQEGKPEEIVEPELSSFTNDFFRLNDGRDGVVFTANAGGVTTSGSSYPRSELREMNGQEKASWSNTAGTHTMRVREAVTRLPAVKPHVVAAQIHDAEDDVIEVRLEGQRPARRVQRRRRRRDPRPGIRARHSLRPRDRRRRRPHPGVLQRDAEGRHRQERSGLVLQGRQLRPVQPVTGGRSERRGPGRDLRTARPARTLTLWSTAGQRPAVVNARRVSSRAR